MQLKLFHSNTVNHFIKHNLLLNSSRVTHSILMRHAINRFSLALLAAIYSGFLPAATTDLQPCWMDNPITDQYSGQIGIARNIYTGGERPIVKSRTRALQQLAERLSVPIETVIDEDTQAIALGSHTAFFTNDYKKDGYIYSFAQLDSNTPISNQCDITQCSLESCTPAWLCQPSAQNEPAVVGVSYLASTPNMQQYKAIENASLIAQYMYGVNVSAQQHLFTSADKSNQFSILKTDQQLTALRPNQITYSITNSCTINSSLFVRLKLNTKDYPLDLTPADNLNWITNPKYKGYDGAVGSVEKRVASGLISDQIKLAVKRAAVQLALEKNAHVKEELLDIQLDKNGSLFVSSIDQSTNVNMNIRLAAIHYLPNSDELFKVLVWVIRI